MTLDKHSAVAIVEPLGVALSSRSARVTLDESWSPYCEARLTCSMPLPAVRELLDLRDEQLMLDLRVRQDFGAPWTLADLTTEGGGSMAAITTIGTSAAALTNRLYTPWNAAQVRAARSRQLRLYVVDRVFDDVADTLELVARSGEVLLRGDALVDTDPIDPGTTSLKAIVQGVLDRYGVTLDPASLDATVAEAEATIWKPGITAWAYLSPLLEAASLRLWCDETGVFRITERQSASPGAVAITPTGTMTGLRDRMSLDPEVRPDAVVVEYRWVDDFDLNQIAYDVAGVQPATAALHIQRQNIRYPGPGAAAGILNRAQGRGRVLEVTAVNDYTATPGMAAILTPVVGDIQTGYVSAVTWRLPEAEMDLTTRGLVDTPETSWLFTDAGIGWDDIAAGVSWEEYAA